MAELTQALGRITKSITAAADNLGFSPVPVQGTERDLYPSIVQKIFHRHRGSETLSKRLMEPQPLLLPKRLTERIPNCDYTLSTRSHHAGDIPDGLVF